MVRVIKHHKARGFSLVELTVVLLLITLIAGVAVRETSELTFQTRYEQTRERLEMIHQAILGNPRQIINGQQAVSGFVADMGRLPNNIRELIQRSGDCDKDGGDVSQAACAALSGTWTTNAWNSNAVSPTDPASGLRYGWNGPYLNISGNPADSAAMPDGWGRLAQGYCSIVSYTTQVNCTGAGGSWVAAEYDFNYGWYFDTASFPDGLFVLSYGKDQAYGATDDYDQDYPTNQPMINRHDWWVNLSGGISVSFKKSTGKISPVSHCSDPTKNDKSSCEPPGGTGTWAGGCNKAGHYNKSSCATDLGTWVNCSDGSSASKTACESAGKEWYGEGFGCSDQSRPLKDQCTSPNVWRSCSDDGTITDESACLAADQLWYGDTIFNNALSTQRVCMRVFYRRPDSTIGMLISDENVANDSPTVHFDPKTIIADGGFQSLRFASLRDRDSKILVTELPIGTGAIGIYKHDGTDCTDQFYPSDRQSPARVDLHAHAGVPVINW
ncbi:MAG: prepilin-type N-terminal cleavage/methylation domain-containing protein [Gammaproteobacteria bacterium]